MTSNEYTSLALARSACATRALCTGVYDLDCDGAGMFALCTNANAGTLVSGLATSTRGSCVHLQGATTIDNRTSQKAALPLAAPEMIHLSYGADPNTIIVAWSSAVDGASAVLYGIGGTGSAGARLPLATVVTGSSSHFRQRFSKFGSIWDDCPRCVAEYLHVVRLTDLTPGQSYSYQIAASKTTSESAIYSFTAGRDTGQPDTLAIFGDLGIEIPPDDEVSPALGHMIDEANSGTIGGVFHVGDLAYDFNTDGGHYAQTFFRLIEPLAAVVPYMTAMGNHEGGTRISGSLQHYFSRFEMPGKFWTANLYYSMDFGPAHIVVFSSEVYFWQKWWLVPQWFWLKRELANVDRSVTPWLITMGHRPPYCSNANPDDCTTDESKMRRGLCRYYHQCSEAYYGVGAGIVFFGVLLCARGWLGRSLGKCICKCNLCSRCRRSQAQHVDSYYKYQDYTYSSEVTGGGRGGAQPRRRWRCYPCGQTPSDESDDEILSSERKSLLHTQTDGVEQGGRCCGCIRCCGIRWCWCTCRKCCSCCGHLFAILIGLALALALGLCIWMAKWQIQGGEHGFFAIEPLLYNEKVDLAFWAHEHSYERLWPTYNGHVLNSTTPGRPYHNALAPVHLIAGAAGSNEGYDQFPCGPDGPCGTLRDLGPWSAFRDLHYGYGRLHLVNTTHLRWDQKDDDGEIVDEFWLSKD